MQLKKQKRFIIKRIQVPKETDNITFPFSSQTFVKINYDSSQSKLIQQIAVDFNSILRPEKESYPVSLF